MRYLLIAVAVAAGVLVLTRPFSSHDGPPDKPSGEPAPAAPRIDSEAEPPAFDDAEIRAGLERLDDLSRAERISLLRRGLRSGDRAVAFSCANHLEWQWLDHAECDLFVRILWSELRNPETEVPYEDLRSAVGSSDLDWMLEDFPGRTPNHDGEYMLESIHRQLRPKHLPVLCRLALSPDRDTARGAFADLCIALEYTDRHREAVARTLLELRPLRGERSVPDDSSTLLRSLTQRFLENWDAGSGDWIRPKTWEHFRGAIEQWIKRWRLEVEGDMTDRIVNPEPKSSDDLAFLLRDAPTEGIALLRREVLGDDEPSAFRILNLLREAIAESLPRYRIVWRPNLFDGLGALALRQRMSGYRLARIGEVVPGCRTREIARTAADLIRRTPALPPGLDRYSFPDVSFLEVCAPDEVRPMLRALAARGNPELRDFALGSLLMLGDAESAAELIEWVEGEELERGEARLARSACPEIEAWLRTHAKKIGNLTALATLYGLPEGVEWPRNAPAECLRLVLEKRPLDALVLALEKSPDSTPWNLGRVKDDRVRAHLERLRQKRELGVYAWATGELAVMGDPAAREETWKVMQAGRYRWVDNADTGAMTLGHDLTTIPFWISELETNCCRFNVVAAMLDDLLPIDPDEYRRNYAMTAYEVMKAWWDEHGDRLVWSRAANHFVPGPE